MAILSERDAREIVDRILDAARADAVTISLGSREGGNLRFANNQASTAGELSDVTVSVTAALGSRRGTAETSGVDPDALREVVRRAEDAARLAPEDPEYVPPLEPTEFPAPAAFHATTAEYGPAERGAAAVEAIGEAAARDTVLAGLVVNHASGRAIPNSKGLFAYHPETWH